MEHIQSGIKINENRLCVAKFKVPTVGTTKYTRDIVRQAETKQKTRKNRKTFYVIELFDAKFVSILVYANYNSIFTSYEQKKNQFITLYSTTITLNIINKSVQYLYHDIP